MTDDTIYRQAAIEEVFNEPLCESGMKEKTAIAVVLAIYEKIKALPSAQSEPQWIPCSERLPEKSDLYCVSGKGKVWICEFHIIPNFIGGWRNDVSNPVVQAWMPLPEPYKEGE